MFQERISSLPMPCRERQQTSALWPTAHSSKKSTPSWLLLLTAYQQPTSGYKKFSQRNKTTRSYDHRKLLLRRVASSRSSFSRTQTLLASSQRLQFHSRRPPSVWPADRYPSCPSSTSPGSDSHWTPRYNEVLEARTSVRLVARNQRTSASTCGELPNVCTATYAAGRTTDHQRNARLTMAESRS